MNQRSIATSLLLILFAVCTSFAQDTRPLRALLICGGCCHDYEKQHKILSDGIMERANIQVDVWWTNDRSTNPPLTVYNHVNWANGYDVIIHDECAASNKDVEVMKRILKVHEKTPAVHLHCAMHSFRNGTDLWFKHLGLKSTGHGPHKPIDVEIVDKAHPIMAGMENWSLEKDELYNNAEVYDAHALAIGTQVINEKRTDKAIVVWTNEKSGARSFSTTLGHYNEVVSSDRYLNLVTRGTLWACNQLKPEYLKPYKGKNKITFVESKKAAKPKPVASKQMPKNATLVHATSSSTQDQHVPAKAIDGDKQTRWCAENGSYPQWLKLEFKAPRKLKSVKTTWEFERAYQYKIEGSVDGKQWTVLADRSKNQDTKQGFDELAEHDPIKMLKITGISSQGGWCSIREVNLKGKGIKSLWPANENFQPFFEPTPADPLKKQGNIEPTIQRLSPEKEAEILRDVKVAEGFEATLFAAPPAVNYPVFVAAAPDGTLFVSSDGNGSLGRDPGRGRVIRLRDTDGDGRADETQVFCKVDAPRGLFWDHDRLYLMHPPHLSAFIDLDGDGVADKQQILVKNLAFGYDKRPADHTTNGLSMGLDGYLYIAGGDFGFIDAEGTDGTKLTHRGGGVIRVRPDGTGLELYSTGTRNILEVAISPEMDLFARDNTNDGGGWNVRFHHFTGGDDHGYPRLYKNFAEECIAPLADYGGGSGCGAVYIKEPGFGSWNDSPYSADWGTGAIYRHAVVPEGATFKETGSPQPIVKMTRPTDADVDGMSRLYCASWKGATFKWEGANVGYIVQIKPKNHQPEPLPDFQSLNRSELTKQFVSGSYRRQLAAQLELFRRGDKLTDDLLAHATRAQTPERKLVQQIQNSATDSEIAAALNHTDPVVVHVAIRELAQRKAADACFSVLNDRSRQHAALRAIGMMHETPVVEKLIRTLHSTQDKELRNAILSTLCRLHFIEGEWNGQSWGTRPDTRGPYYQPETWSGTSMIATELKSAIAAADGANATQLIREMNRNRIQDDSALQKMIQLAESDPAMIGDAVELVSAMNRVPDKALPVLIQAAHAESADAEVLSKAIVSLARSNQPRAIEPAFHALAQIERIAKNDNRLKTAYQACLRSRTFENQVSSVVKIAQSNKAQIAFWADAVLLAIADRKNASPEAKQLAADSIEKGWELENRRTQLIQAAGFTGNHYLDDQIVSLISQTNSPLDPVVATAAKQLRLSNKPRTGSPKIGTLKVSAAIDKATRSNGNAKDGEIVFNKANCIACHTVRMGEKQKGPFLGNIAQTYKRHELATAILDPNKTIAQGFKTNIILDLDGRLVSGYVTEESADKVVMRDSEGKEFTFNKDDIDERKESPVSAMPEAILKDFTVNELASLLDYLESLPSQQK